MKEKLRQYQDLVMIAAVLAAYVIWGLFLPVKCPIRWLTGISCPGCGIKRALISVCKLDFARAWYYNPVIFYLIPAVPVMLIAYLRNAKRLTNVLLWVTAGLLIAVYLCRLLILHSPVLEADFSKGFLAELWRMLHK